MVRDMFNGTPVIEQISATELRITGVSLPPNLSGTIGFFESVNNPNILLPEEFSAPSVEFQGEDVSLAALVKVYVGPDSAGPFTNLQPSVSKTVTTSPEDFLIKITNTNVSLTTQDLEIYVTFMGQASTSSGIVINVIDSAGATVTVSPEC